MVFPHLHPDHCGGNTLLVDGSWVPTFLRASYLFSRTEFTCLESVHAARPADGPEAALAATFADSALLVVDAGRSTR